MLGGFRFKRRAGRSPIETSSAEDPLRAFADWAAQRAEGVCWVRRAGRLDDLFVEVAEDLPELGRSSVRWSGAGVLHDSGVEWFAFEGADAAVLMFALGRASQLETRQLAVLSALSQHAAFVVKGGAVPDRLRRDLSAVSGVPVWGIQGLGRLRPADLHGSAAALAA